MWHMPNHYSIKTDYYFLCHSFTCPLVVNKGWYGRIGDDEGLVKSYV